MIKKSFCFFCLFCLFCLFDCCKDHKYSFKFKTQTKQKIAKHVILIGIDGWGSIFDKSSLPNIEFLMKNGSFSKHKRSVLPLGSATNWASMISGVGPETHGFTKWNSKCPVVKPILENGRGMSPTCFSLLAGYETGCAFDWEGMKYVIDSIAIGSLMNFSDNVDNLLGNTEVCAQYIANKKPTFFFCAFDGLSHKRLVF